MHGRTPFLYRFQDTKAIMLAAAKIYILKQFTTEEFHYHGAVGLYGSVEAQMVNGESAAFFFYPFYILYMDFFNFHLNSIPFYIFI